VGEIGARLPWRSTSVKKGPDLNSLRTRLAFQKLLVELEAKSK
jgi:hypothetical protein